MHPKKINPKINRMCQTDKGKPKIRYETRADAKEVIRKVPDLAGTNPYRCDACGWFHIGTYPANPVTRARLRSRHEVMV